MKAFCAIFSLAIFLLFQTTESHHMFRWESSQIQGFQKLAIFKLLPILGAQWFTSLMAVGVGAILEHLLDGIND